MDILQQPAVERSVMTECACLGIATSVITASTPPLPAFVNGQFTVYTTQRHKCDFWIIRLSGKERPKTLPLEHIWIKNS